MNATELRQESLDTCEGRCLVLVGMTGVGKSTIGVHLARTLNRRFIDLDRYICDKTGRTIPQIFAEKGEPGFRSLESRALLDCLAMGSDVVLATGGGAVTQAPNREALKADPLVVWLHADVEALLGRVGSDQGRPLLRADPRGTLTSLSSSREPWYQEVADVVIQTDGFPISEVVQMVASRVCFDTEVPTIVQGSPTPMTAETKDSPAPLLVEQVQLGGGRSYSVVVGDGARRELANLIPEGVQRAAIVTQHGIDVPVNPGVDHQVFMVDAGERAKRMSVVEDLARSFAKWGMTRNDIVISVGGGVVTDLGGFVAATYHRGIKVIHVSTTLLGQIDAAIGGKCGVNLPEGKNLVGAFWQPSAVICDTETLSTLSKREFTSGMGELAKYHFLGGGELDKLDLPSRVAACVRIKADVVAEDEREGGRRAILNYGHTLAHALETSSASSQGGEYQIRHGEAVAIGLVYAAELAHALGRIDADRVGEHRRVVSGYGLSHALPAGVEHTELVELFKRDKKAFDGITFVLDGPLGVETVRIDDEGLLLDCLAKLDQEDTHQPNV